MFVNFIIKEVILNGLRLILVNVNVFVDVFIIILIENLGNMKVVVLGIIWVIIIFLFNFIINDMCVNM